MTYRLVWHKHPDVPRVWVADGVFEGQWYAIRRHDAKRWGATFHDGASTAPCGGGTFNAVRRACAEHATAQQQAAGVGPC